MTAELTEQQEIALDIARGLAGAGIPLFIAQPDPSAKTGFRPPKHWERTAADPGVVDRWRPGLALCAVMGCGLDLIDIDPRNGGTMQALDGLWPGHYGIAATPSGGFHYLVASLGVGSRDNILPGIDVKGGLPDGSGRGFAFIAPTVRASVVSGELTAYRWLEEPDAPGLRGLGGGDVSGLRLAERITQVRADGTGMRSGGGPDWWQSFVAAREPQSAPAAERAITAKVAEVSGWVKDSGVGFRAVLLRAALTLGGYVGGGYLEESIARKRLDEAVCEVWGAADADDQLWIQQGLDDGAVQPFHVYTVEDEFLHSEVYSADAGGGDGQGGREPAWTIYSAIGLEPFDPRGGTDQEMAEEVIARMYPGLRYAADVGSWLVRGAQIWTERDDLAGWATSTLARLMPLGDPDLPKKKEDYTAENWTAARRNRFMNAGSAGPIERKMRTLVNGGDHPAAIDLGVLDAHPEVLWAGGVPWDLRASEEVPRGADVDPATPHLHTALCAPAVAPTPRWDAFVAAVWPDLEVRAWALRVLSLSLAGYPDAALPVLYGAERTGKTALVSLIVKVLGSYGHAADPRLLSGADTAHASIVYALKGRRLSFIDEGPRRGHLAAERLKQLTGGGDLTGNAMRADPVTFSPTHTMAMTTNDEPAITDPALRARIRLIPCDGNPNAVRAARSAITAGVFNREAPGVLAGLMGHCARWLEDPDSGLTAAAPASIRDLALDLAQAQDPIREWVENCTVPTEPGTQARTLYTAFCTWHQAHPLYRKTVIPSVTSFGRGLSDLGFPPSHTKNGNVRPISILGWTGGAQPTPPTPAAFLGQSEPVAERVTGPGRVERRVEDQPVTDENSRSGPILSSSVTSLTSSQPPIQIHTKHTPHIHTLGPGGTESNPSPVTPVTPTLTDVAKRATSATVTKAEARAQLKAEARDASIRAAAGETCALPAAVTRDGTIVPLTVEQAATIVRGAVDRSAALTVDVETTGYPVGHGDYALRSVQLGDATAAVVFDPVAHGDAVRTLLDAAPALHAHSATADLVPLAHAGLIDAEQAWERMHDTVIPAKLADPASTGSDPGLKKLSPAVLGDQASVPAADDGRAALFKAGGWLKDTKVDTPIERSGWAQVDTRSATMLRYAASDVLDTAALAQVLPRPAAAVYERERLAQRMTARVAHHGVRLDPAQIAALTAQHSAGLADATTRVRAFGVDNPGSDQQVGIAAAQLGAELPRTPSGRPSVAAGVLEPLRGADGPLGEFVAAVLDHRHAETALGLFLNPYRQLCDRGDGRARPTVYTLGTDTGRMCLPTSHGLVTPDGVIPAELVAAGMTTLDAAGNWVSVLDVHRYPDTEIETLSNRGIELACTAEHRWLTTRDHEAGYAARMNRPAPAPEMRRLVDHPRLRLHLAPEVEPFDFDARSIPAVTDAQRFAALVGMLATDGRCVEARAPESGLRAYVYQSETKFYDEFSKVIPDDAVMYDRITGNGDRHHEIRIKVRWLRPRLNAAGLTAGKLLKESADLYGWAARLPLDELRAFFSACWLADGTLKDHRMSCGSATLRAVLTLAAYRLGFVAYPATCGPSEWSTKDRTELRFREPVIQPRKSERGHGRADVWCVTTATGTFTAHTPTGTTYLTGNSCVRPNLQQLPREGGMRACLTADPGQLMIGADFSGVEIRVAAALSQDPNLMRMLIDGRDLHAEIAELVWGPFATKQQAKAARYRAKPMVFQRIYGGGVAGIARQAGVPLGVAQAVVGALDKLTPQLSAWSTGLSDAVKRGLTQFPTYAGRVIYLPVDRPFAAANYAIQGSARELLVDALVRWQQTRWGGCVLLPVHDELDVFVPEADAAEAVAELVRCMETDLYGVHIAAEPSVPAFAWADSA